MVPGTIYGGDVIRTRIVFLGIVVAAMTLGAAISQYGQDAAIVPPDANSRHSLAVGLLRSINTVEFDYRVGHGSYVGWDDLLASKEFMEFEKDCLAHIPEFATAHFTKGPEILPGWNLRLNLTQDGNGRARRHSAKQMDQLPDLGGLGGNRADRLVKHTYRGFQIRRVASQSFT